MRFDSKYVAAGRVARTVGTRTGCLLQALKGQNVYAVSGKSVDGGPQYFLRRADLPSLKRKGLIFAFPLLNVKKRKRTVKIDSVAAAKILSVKTGLIPGLIRNGILHHYVESETATGEYIFNRTYIERFQGQFKDISDVVAPGAAAKLLKTPLTKMYGQWIKPGYLKCEISKDGKIRYLRKSKVQKIVLFKESVVNCAEAAALLGTPYWRVETLILNGVLKPVTNPYPEALRHLLYSKAQVKKLRGKKITLIRRKRPSVKSST